MFSEEFVRAYERQVAEFQRHDRDGTAASGPHDVVDQAVDPGLMKTQKLDPSTMVPNETAFEEDDVVDALSKSGAVEIDQDQIKA